MWMICIVISVLFHTFEFCWFFFSSSFYFYSVCLCVSCLLNARFFLCSRMQICLYISKCTIIQPSNWSYSIENFTICCWNELFKLLPNNALDLKKTTGKQQLQQKNVVVKLLLIRTRRFTHLPNIEIVLSLSNAFLTVWKTMKASIWAFLIFVCWNGFCFDSRFLHKFWNWTFLILCFWKMALKQWFIFHECVKITYLFLHF